MTPFATAGRYDIVRIVNEVQGSGQQVRQKRLSTSIVWPDVTLDEAQDHLRGQAHREIATAPADAEISLRRFGLTIKHRRTTTTFSIELKGKKL